MTDLSDLLRQGTTHAWLFVPTAMLLGALHGLEPGHSKTMMAAFIIAVRGSVTQAVLLGLSAAASHTLVVWAVALIGLHYAGSLDAEAAEPYFQLAAAAMVVGIAGWMLWRTWREGRHGHDHHHDAIQRIDTGAGTAALEIFEDGVPPRWRIRFEAGRSWPAEEVAMTTLRPGGERQDFAFAERGGYLESLATIPEPHAFEARLRLGQGDAARDYALDFHEHDGDDDAHARAHAAAIRRRFATRRVTTPQIILFGLTGGLIPCPAAITVLLLCLQLRQFSLGVTLVLCFSIGLAAIMVAVGVTAALGMRHAERRWTGTFDRIARRAPYVSGAVILLAGLALGYQGWVGLPAGS